MDAVSGVDLTIAAGETVALVGESGSGKSTTALAIAGLLPASAEITAGAIISAAGTCAGPAGGNGGQFSAGISG